MSDSNLLAKPMSSLELNAFHNSGLKPMPSSELSLFTKSNSNSNSNSNQKSTKQVVLWKPQIPIKNKFCCPYCEEVEIYKEQLAKWKKDIAKYRSDVKLLLESRKRNNQEKKKSVKV